jgi:anaerobic selenocysteine-containing dehydrogenase
MVIRARGPMTEQRCLTCNLCEAMCGLVATVEQGRVTDLRGDPDDPFSRGHICPKGPALASVLEDPDRLREPMRRTTSGWQRIPWDEAIAETAARLAKVRAEGGRDALGLYIGNPSVHNPWAVVVLPGFAQALGTRNSFDANSQDANPKLFQCFSMFGDLTSITVPDVDRTEFFLMLGANPAASNGSVMTLGDVRKRIQGIKERGGRLVLLDPRRTETAAWATEHHFLRPGSDAAFLLSFLHVLFEEKLVSEEKVNAIARGLETVRSLAKPFTPERTAASTGISAATVRALARDFARSKAAVAYGRVGTCQNAFGAVVSWLLEVVNVVTGNFDRAGGSMFPTPAIDFGAAPDLVPNHYGRWKSRVRGLPEFGERLPAACLAEEIETEGEGQIRALVTFAGNPVLSTPNGERLGRALERLEFMVSIDYYLNETTRHAHIVLPPTHALERAHYDLVFQGLAVRNTVKYSPPVVPKAKGALEDWEILYELAMRLGGMRFGIRALDVLAKTAWRLFGAKLSPERAIDFLLRMGRHGDRFRPFSSGLSLAKLARSPHGIDLGPLIPARKEKVKTADGRVDLAPGRLVAEVPSVERWIERAREPGTLELIGRRHVRSNNSWMHNVTSLTKGPDRTALLMNPEDARRLGVSGGDRVRVKSRTGSVVVRLETTTDVMPGVVSLPHGWGHESAKDTLRVAGGQPGANANALTDDLLVEPVLGTAVLNGVPVTVEPVRVEAAAAT